LILLSPAPEVSSMASTTETATKSECLDHRGRENKPGRSSGSFSDSAVTAPAPTSTPYTTFTRAEKHYLTALLGTTTITSPLTATTYFPLLPLLRTHFHTSAQAINLTITLYIIFQALSPAIFGPLSDSLGRRPIYLVTLFLYAVANLGLAVNKHSYGALLGLRALQSLGASAASAISYGVVADVCVPSERGRMIGPVSMALNLGATVGPIIGGCVAYKSGSYEWVFWALAMIGAVLLLAMTALLPETARNVVGNGSHRRHQRWWEKSLWRAIQDYLQERRKDIRDAERSEVKDDSIPGDSVEAERHGCLKRVHMRNPLSCLRIIFYRDTFLTLWMHSSFYAVDYSIVAAVPDIYKNSYAFNELQIGLSYLPRGVGIIIGNFCNGRVMDHNYKAVARKVGWAVDAVSGDDLRHFPIERARARGFLWLLLVSTTTLVGYGWAVDKHVHVSIPLMLQFVQGFFGTCFYTTFNTLVVDIFPESPSTAAAAASVSRCAMAAAAVALLQPLLDAAGRGWYFTVLGLWSGGFGVVAVVLLKQKGMQWRVRRIEKSTQPSSSPMEE